jgi:DNA-binding MarR family transcriptional regulator
MLEDGRQGGVVTGSSWGSRSAEELADTLGEFLNYVKAHLNKVVQPYDLAPPSAKALCLIEGSISMKELGSRMHCDGSFVTGIADTLEERGLARREIDQNDRRIKNLVLSDQGRELRDRLLRDLFEDFPGLRNLDEEERQAFLALLRKMVSSEAQRGLLPEAACAPLLQD